MSVVRLVLAIPLIALGCGGTAPSGASLPTTATTPTQTTNTPPEQQGGQPPIAQTGSNATGAPGTPAAAPLDPNPPPVGTSGSNRFQMGAASGLYLVDPANGEPSVQGLVVVTLGPIGTGNFIPPDDTTVTMNGVPLQRAPNLNGAYWQVDPAGPQPQIGSGGRMVLVASATVAGQRVERSLVLPCPSDIEVTSTPAVGSTLTLAPPAAPLHLSSASDITLNVGIPILAGVFPAATLYGYDPATRRLAPSGSPTLIARGPLELDVPVLPTAAPAYLLDLRWPGQWVPDGESGAFCGLVKRWTYGK